jgi:hypothetical protein
VNVPKKSLNRDDFDTKPEVDVEQILAERFQKTKGRRILYYKRNVRDDQSRFLILQQLLLHFCHWQMEWASVNLDIRDDSVRRIMQSENSHMKWMHYLAV